MTSLDCQFQVSLIGSWSFVLFFLAMGNGSNETDQLALLALKSKITDDPFKLFTSWNDSVHFCQWNGVACGRCHRQRVVLLDLRSLKLSGNISPYIVFCNPGLIGSSRLSMTSLDCQFQVSLIGSWSFVLFFLAMGNDSNETDQLALLALKSKITDDPFKLFTSWNDSVHFCQWNGVTCGRRHHQRVVLLDLRSLKLSGNISPYIGNLNFLRALHLQNNSFVHIIPPELGHLRRLEVLHLNNNSINGEIPANLSIFSKLIDFDVAYNNLVGLTNLKIIAVGVNNFSGTIPSSIFNLSGIRVFDLAVNHIRGSLPSKIGNVLPNLEIFLELIKLKFSFKKWLDGQIPKILVDSEIVGVMAIPQSWQISSEDHGVDYSSSQGSVVVLSQVGGFQL
ncbi:hypothetical protein ACSBR2_007745 [Camellia fascicularis]